MPEISNGKIRNAIFYWAGTVAIILATGFAVVKFIQQPVLDAVQDVRADVSGNRQYIEDLNNRTTTLEANYSNIQENLKDIKNSLNKK